MNIYRNYNYFTLFDYSHQRWVAICHWSLSDSKSPRVSWTFLSILADLNCIVVWMVSILPLTSNSTTLFSDSFGTPFQVHQLQLVSPSSSCFSFCSSLARSKYLSIFLLSFIFTLVCFNSKIYFMTRFFFS